MSGVILIAFIYRVINIFINDVFAIKRRRVIVSESYFHLRSNNCFYNWLWL